jgi:DNA-binding CsgD family transcriptional regulator
MKNIEHEVRANEPSLRGRWPKGFLGWLAYLHDHVWRGLARPVDWSSLWALEQCGHGFPVFANGTVVVLHDAEVEVLRLLGKGLSHGAVAASLQIDESEVHRTSRKIIEGLGLAHRAEIAAIAADHGLQ